MVIGNCAPSGFHSAGFVAGGRGDLTTLCLLRLLGDDVDHSVYGIGSPHHSPRTPYHFDLLYVAHGDIDRVPDDAGKQRRIERPPVDHDQNLVGIHPRRPADGHRVGTVVQRENRHARHPAEGFGNRSRARPADILGSQHEDRGWRFRNLLRLATHRRHLHVEQFVYSDFGQIVSRRPHALSQRRRQ